MTTTININLEIDNTGVLVLERGDLATMVTLNMAEPHNESLVWMLHNAIEQALAQIEPIISNPPPEVTIPVPPKPAPAAPGKSKTTAKKSTPTPAVTRPTPTASTYTPPPPPKPVRWWTNEDDGKVIRDDAAESKPGYSGPYISQAEAEQNVPAWLKPAFKSKKARA